MNLQYLKELHNFTVSVYGWFGVFFAPLRLTAARIGLSSLLSSKCCIPSAQGPMEASPFVTRGSVGLAPLPT